jgi:hypothetical protein
MTLVLSESFEGGTNGTALSGVNTNYTAGVTVSSATATFDNSIIGSVGQICAKLLQSASSGTVSATSALFPAPTTLYRKWCTRLSSVPNGNFYIAAVLASGGSNAGRVAINSTGKVFLQDGSTTIATGTYSLVANKWYRFEWDIVGTTATVRVYLGQWSQTPVDTITGTVVGTAIVQTQSGIVASAASTIMTVWLDEDTADTATPQSLVPGSGSFEYYL